MKPLTLTKTEIQQLIHYAEQAGEDGWYYGNRGQYMKRHRNIMTWLNKQLESFIVIDYEGKEVK